MQSISCCIAKVAIFLFLSATHFFAYSEVLIAKVVGITDGDTITVIDGENHRHIIRLMGIDAPEKSQPYGNKAKESLSELVYGKMLKLSGTKKIAMDAHLGKYKLMN